MTSLKELLAFNMKEHRRQLGISQAKLAVKVNTSTHYIAMIELGKKSPSIEMMERIAAALEINPAELFSMQTVPLDTVKNLQKEVLADIGQAVGLAVDLVIADRLKFLQV